MTEILSSLLTPTNIGIAVTAILGLLGTFVLTTNIRRRNVALVAFHAYQISKTIGDAIPGEDGFDKAARVLKVADDYAKAKGWRPLKESEKDLVTLTAASLEAQEKVLALGSATASPKSPLSAAK